MMALTTIPLQGSCSTFPSVPSSLSRGSKVKQFPPTFHPVGRKDRLISLRCRPCSSVGASIVLGSKSKLVKILAFRGNSRHEDPGGRTNGSKSLNNLVKVPYFQHESGESPVDSSKAQNVVPARYTIADDATTRSLAMQILFKKWLTLLRTPSRIQEVNGAREEPSPVELSQTPNTLQKQERGGILKAVWCYFSGLDATIKIPLLIFTPLYLAINIIYGSEVSKELTPLWILGPLIVVLQVKMFRAICGLYMFTFKQTAKIVKNLPAYLLLVHEYIFRGKLKEATRMYIWQPLADARNMDYNKVIRGWLFESYLDFIESIWPYYNRLIRFLVKANLI